MLLHGNPDLVVRHNYSHLNRWMKNLYWNNPAFKETTDFSRKSALLSVVYERTLMVYGTEIKEHYYYSHAQINPTRVVPLGPKPDIEPL